MTFEAQLLRNDVQPALGGDFVATLGHQHRHLRLGTAGDADHFVGGRHLEVELDLGELGKAAHIVVVDVAPVLAQVDGDAVSATKMRFHRGPRRVRLPGATRLAQRGDVVDIDAEFDHQSSCSSCNTRRECSGLPPRVWFISMRNKCLDWASVCAREKSSSAISSRVWPEIRG